MKLYSSSAPVPLLLQPASISTHVFPQLLPPTASPPPFPYQARSPRLSSTIPHPMFNLLRQAALFEYIQLTAHPAFGFQSLRGKLTCQKQLWSSRNLREKYTSVRNWWLRTWQTYIFLILKPK